MLHLMYNHYKTIKMGVTSQGTLRKYYKKNNNILIKIDFVANIVGNPQCSVWSNSYI